MYPFIETIRIEKGKIHHLSYHQQRVNRTFAHFWPERVPLNLQQELSNVPDGPGVFKARLVYDENGKIEQSYTPYTPRTIHSLKLIQDDVIDYTYKSTNRSELSRLTDLRGEADEIIIVKNGLLTDTSYSNIALFDGNQWFTPSTPLLQGTMRQWLMDHGVIIPAEISVTSLQHFEKIALINAMMPLGVCVVHRDCIFSL